MSKTDYKLTVGLEIHAELKTRTKMFCDSRNDPNESKPNVNICPVCMGYPGTLPTINKEAVRSVLRLGVALRGKLADFTEFDRKNYFYPDIPKGYQLSQYKRPLVSGGELLGVKVTRVHLEEDTARSQHSEDGSSLLDFNRAGVPLMELVTEPVISTPEMASDFARELQLLLRYLDISEANMEKGEMRVEANISVSKDNKFGTKVEVKNLNSFKVVERAIRFEMERQIDLLERGEEVAQETRGWNENKAETFSQRIKEDSHDYRYFPDPDLPKLYISQVPDFAPETLKKSLPELPGERRERFKREFGIKAEDIEIFVRDTERGDFFEKVVRQLEPDSYQLASNYINTDLKSLVDPEDFVELLRMNASGEISSRATKDILKLLEAGESKPRKIAEEKNLLQISDRDTLVKIVDEVIAEEGGGKPKQFLVGQAMKKSLGRANPVMLQSIFDSKIS